MSDLSSFVLAGTFSLPEAPPSFPSARGVSELASNPMSYNEWVIGQRIHDALMRTVAIMGADIPNSAYLHFKSSVLTIDFILRAGFHRRIVLGADNRATFMEYHASDDLGRKITRPPHFAAERAEKNIESALIQAKNYAVDAQWRII